MRAGAGPMQAQGLFDIPDKRGKYGLVHNVGLGGAVVVSLLRRPEFYKEGGKDGRDRYVPLRHLRALGWKANLEPTATSPSTSDLSFINNGV